MAAQQGLWKSSADRRPASISSTPYESATCSPRSSTDRAMSCFFSANTPTCPVEVAVNIESSTDMGFVSPSSIFQLEEPASDDFDFSARFSEADLPWSPAPMSSADELFCNGQIRPLWCTSEDFTYSYAAQSEYNYCDDDDSCFDFRSSADYEFTKLAMQHSPMGYGLRGQHHDQDQKYLRRPVSTLTMEEVRDMGDGVQKTVESLPRQASRRRDVDMIAKHIMKVKVEESRGRRVCGSSIRRTRSLSPSRVFHMDDEAPRQSYETKESFHLAKEDKEQEEKPEGGETARRKGTRLTLKELLHASEQAEQRVASKMGARIGSKQQVKARMDERSNLGFKSSPTHRIGNSAKGPSHVVHGQGARSLHGRHYSSPRVYTEQMRQQTFLPYRRGVLGCLGFTSKSYRCMAGIKSFHSKSQGSR